MAGNPERPEANTRHLPELNGAMNGALRATGRESRQPEAEDRKLCVEGERGTLRQGAAVLREESQTQEAGRTREQGAC